MEELVEVEIETDSLLSGMQRAFIHGRDSNGNWGPFYEFDFYVIAGLPVIDVENNLIFVTSANNIHAIDLKTREFAWQKTGIYGISPALVEGNLFIIEPDSLIVVDAVSGKTEWSFRATGGYTKPPIVSGGQVFLVSNSHIYAVNLTTHRSEWNTNRTGEITVANNHLYIADPGGSLFVYEHDLSTGVESNSPSVPHAYSISQNYPNPFNPTTRISYSLAERHSVTLKVFSIDGREVMTLVDESQAAGGYVVSLDAGTLASGVYFYQLIAGQFKQTRKMTLLK